VFASTNHSSRRTGGLAAVILAIATVGGCAAFNADHWNLDRYRDERAVDIESRLDREKPIVQNPF
jgi:hypothetical protein